jgi:uncharacterized protein YecE (DUF72 family)
MISPVRVGVAGWSLRPEAKPHFPETGTHLQRYAGRLNAVEINSSFYRPHREATYARWGECVPPDFRFSVKLPRTITHDQRLHGAGPLLDAFLPGPAALGERLGCLLVQLPPSLEFESGVAEEFLGALRQRYAGPAVLEPRHPTWFAADAEELLLAARVGRVAADPPRDPLDGRPAGCTEVVYYRMHGSQRIYYSAYPPEQLEGLSGALRAWAEQGAEAWCIFDNTALGFATFDALTVTASVGRG